ncbi:MAG: DegV family protein [Erysipelotrichaceae bacterium]|nr:DegV family protein [Erysipelotrichaceae bacterium]
MRIIADSSCDLYSPDLQDFKTVPLTVYTDERSFLDAEDLDVSEMLDYLARYKDRSYTSCPSIDAWSEAFAGADEIIAVTITSALSGSYNSALSAAQMYMDEHPGAKISVIDSLSTGGEEILLIEKIDELRKQGLSFEEIDAGARAYLKTTRLFFSFFSLHNLAQNGRVNKIVAASLNVLNIGVTGTATEEGTIAVTGKARGEKKCQKVLLEEMEKAGFNGKRAVITHTENPEGAESLKELVLSEYPQADISIHATRGLCSYYMERRGVVICLETNKNSIG